jgi:uncharacterized protein
MGMKIETHHIPSRGMTLNYQKEAGHFITLKEMTAAGACQFKSPLTINLEVVPARDYIEVTGQLTTVVELACSRCAEAFDLPLTHPFKLTYSQKIPKALQSDEEESAELTADQIGVVFFRGEEIDFTDTVQEQVVLALPFKALCSEQCKGLCAHCGIDLNHNTCQCDRHAASSPFDVLKNLKLPPRQ